MKAVVISNQRTGRTSIYSGFKSDLHAENYQNSLELPAECTLNVIDVTPDQALMITTGFRG